MAAGVAAASLRSLVSRRPARITAGTLVIGFGAWGLAHSLILGGHT
jgi:hypothetical protein